MGRSNEKVEVHPDEAEVILPPKLPGKNVVVTKRFELSKIATATEEVIVDKDTDSVLTINEALVQLMNDVKDLKKGLL
jgi:hypothetical protein